MFIRRTIFNRLFTLLLLWLGAVTAWAGPWENPGHQWQAQPARAAILVISGHPDDEGIFFGGALPYYTRVRQLPTVHISLNDGDWSGQGYAQDRRRDELLNADWVYGLRHQPIVPDDFPGEPGNGGAYPNPIDTTWDWWNDQELDGFNLPGQDAAAGRQRTIEYIATQIRTYRPAVVITHDIDGEYGHLNHQATAVATIEAFDVAADAGISLEGLPAYQSQKLYVHQSESNGLGSAGYQFENWLFHDYWEEMSIDFDQDSIPETSPRLVAEAGLAEHVTQGGSNLDVSTVYDVGESFDGHHSEWWGLLKTTVGADRLQPEFTIAGFTYSGWARGDFFQNVDLAPYVDFDAVPGDVNLDGQVSGDGTGDVAEDDVSAFLLGWGVVGSGAVEQLWRRGDMNYDGKTDLFDWHLLRSNHPDRAQLNLSNLLDGSRVPESSTYLLAFIAILSSHITTVWRTRRLHGCERRVGPAG